MASEKAMNYSKMANLSVVQSEYLKSLVIIFLETC
jgi:hypothetical protein